MLYSRPRALRRAWETDRGRGAVEAILRGRAKCLQATGQFCPECYTNFFDRRFMKIILSPDRSISEASWLSR